jgi:hypothetical protein
MIIYIIKNHHFYILQQKNHNNLLKIIKSINKIHRISLYLLFKLKIYIFKNKQ